MFSMPSHVIPVVADGAAMKLFDEPFFDMVNAIFASKRLQRPIGYSHRVSNGFRTR